VDSRVRLSYRNREQKLGVGMGAGLGAVHKLAHIQAEGHTWGAHIQGQPYKQVEVELHILAEEGCRPFRLQRLQ